MPPIRLLGHPAYGLNELHADLERFVFLLGGSDGRDTFGATVEQPPPWARTPGGSFRK